MIEIFINLSFVFTFAGWLIIGSILNKSEIELK